MGKIFIYIDESSIINGINPFYGYDPIGQPNRTNKPDIKLNLSLIAAITEDEIIGYQIFGPSVLALDVGIFILSILENNEYINQNLDQYVFYMDNCQTHNSKVLSVLENRIQILWEVIFEPRIF